MPAICLPSGEVHLRARRGIGFPRRPAARLGPVDHLDHGQEKQVEVLQLDEVVADLPVLQALCQRLARGIDGLEGGGGLRWRGGIGLGGLLQEFRQPFVRHGICQDAFEHGHEPRIVEVGGQDVPLGDGNGPRFDGIADFLRKCQ